MSSDFLNAVKQKLTPSSIVNSGSPVWNALLSPSAKTSSNVTPKAALAGSPAVRLGLAELMAPGGTQQVADIATEYWFSALQPIRPVGPASYRPRQRAFLPGENLIWTPGDDKGLGIGFEALRAMADSWDLLRLVIETRKDQLSRIKWEIRIKQKAGETGKDRKQRQLTDPNVTKLTEFFQYPDGFHDWGTWVRMIVEDILVLDAGAINYQRDLQGRICSLMSIDGATIGRVLTDLGTTPPPPSVAYQQVVYGTPACDMTTDDLLYIMRNERTSRRYGFSPVEQILVSISIGLRRQDFQLKYYTDGNMPEALCFLPSNLPIPRIREIQDWFDSILAGNLAKRRRLTFLPGYGTGSGSDNVRPNIVFPKEALLKDEMDDWLLRIVCYAFSVSPQNLMQQMNRASAEQASNVAEEEGLEPLMTTIETVGNRIIQAMGMSDGYEFTWQEVRDVDPEKQANIDKALCPLILTINETREYRGEDPRPEPEADQLGIVGPTGFVPLGQQSVNNQQQQDGQAQQMNQSQEKHEVSMQQQQQNLTNSSENSESNANQNNNKALIPAGQFVHPIFGDLSKHDDYFAYDPESGTILVKGDIDIQAARKALLDEGFLKK